MLNIDCKKTSLKIQKFIKSKVKELNRDGAIIGLSGGLDSTVVAALCVKALGKGKVLGLIMPEKEGNPQSTKDAKFVAKWLGMKTKVVDITKPLEDVGLYKFILSRIPTRALKEKATIVAYAQMKKKIGEDPYVAGLKGTSNKLISKAMAYLRTKHRMRMVVIYFHGESNNLLVAGAGNKTEKLTGLFCKFGIDNNADIMPIGDLYRTQLLQLAKYLKVPERILSKPSNPEVIPGITDKYLQVAGLSSEKVDLILVGLEKGKSLDQISKKTKIPISKVRHIKKLNERSSHMRNPSMKP